MPSPPHNPLCARTQARKLLIQPHLAADGPSGAVSLKSFPCTPAGMIESFVARYPAEDDALLQLYQDDLPHVHD